MRIYKTVIFNKGTQKTKSFFKDVLQVIVLMRLETL